ncbi:hypothetical protein BJAS_P2767 [Bathymodiolus japonicus methanotrophic gill symbiont]|uniref:hypothetical protein n=1 Tax=Bathymodiolus japonicus methanotrophic gill symbiont TaxID=113269 RepID=UPI001B701632|nr:hypothetical protein [Bathymodiolus japonicus methanotrophic gill symbiont]GFO72486.1 hypothetical protein BJAS_P2767 [Bathymodiolus japonicus methanotrophic gill symbiont]
MKFNVFFLFALLFVFSGQLFAASEGREGDWVKKTVTGDIKATAGCKDKAKAEKQTIPGSYRFKKYTKIMCQNIAYGWGRDKVLDDGELVCEACEGEYEGKEKYRCYMANVKVQCKIVKRGF